jgi:hypothetical protein
MVRLVDRNGKADSGLVVKVTNQSRAILIDYLECAELSTPP